MLTELQEKWLAYAADVIGCDGTHLEDCGAPDAPGADQSLRWPGYIGANYDSPEATRVLCVAQTHNARFFKRRDDIATLQPIMRSWREGKIDKCRFLEEYTSAYADLLSGWGPWLNAFEPVLADARLGLTVRDIAYTNIAKCWQFSNTRCLKLMQSCAVRFPLKDLCDDVLKPRAVIVLIGETTAERIPLEFPPGLPARIFIGTFPQTFSPSDDTIATVADWLCDTLERA